MPRSLARLVRLALRALFVVQCVGLALAIQRKVQMVETDDRSTDEVVLAAIFGSLDFVSTASSFRGGALSCLYGGGVLDLRGARLDPAGATLRVEAFNGGGQILAPLDWNIEISVVGLGGVVDGRGAVGRPADAPVLRIEGWTVFGGFAVATEGARAQGPVRSGMPGDPHPTKG
jgi:hypothetical protein